MRSILEVMSPEGFVLASHRGESFELPSLEVLEETRLEGYAYGVVPSHSPPQETLRATFLIRTARHGLTKANLLSLIKVWNQAGMVPMPIKGFALAEFVYPHPAARFYGDVDIYIPAHQARKTANLALQQGWHEDTERDKAFTPHLHEESRLYSPDKALLLEIHRYPLHTYTAYIPRTLALSQHLWERSRLLEWEGVQIRLSHPVDAALNQILNRYSESHFRRFLAKDFLDLAMLAQKGLSRTELLNQACQLGVGRVVEHFLHHADPWQGRLKLGEVNRGFQFKRAGNLILEWGSEWLAMQGWLLSAHKGRVLMDIVREWPGVQRSLRLMAEHQDMLTLLQQAELPPKPYLVQDARRKLQILRGVRYALRLMGKGQESCIPNALSVFVALRAEGYPAEFVSGVRRINGVLRGHAWVEIAGKPLLGSGDEFAPTQYQENFRYPKPQKT